MRIAAGFLVVLCLAGCTGTVVLESRKPVPAPQPMPGPTGMCCDVTQRQAAEIAVAEAVARQCGDLHVQNVKRDGQRWRVDLTGQCECREARIKVKVDRRSGEIRSYKTKLGDDECLRGRRHHGDDDGHDS